MKAAGSVKDLLPLDPRERTDAKRRFAAEMRANPTPPEERLWAYIKDNGLTSGRVIRQQLLMGWIVDFYVPNHRVVIEVDGSQHLDDDHVAADANRDRAMLLAGYSVLRLSARTVLRDTFLAWELAYDFVNEVAVSHWPIHRREADGRMVTG